MNRHKPPWWSQRTAGCPIGAVACVHPLNSEGVIRLFVVDARTTLVISVLSVSGREDLLLSRNAVAVVRPSALEPKP